MLGTLFSQFFKQRQLAGANPITATFFVAAPTNTSTAAAAATLVDAGKTPYPRLSPFLLSQPYPNTFEFVLLALLPERHHGQ